MRPLRTTLAGLLIGALSAGPAAAGASSSASKSEPGILSRMGSATTGFFQGVKDTFTPKSSTAKKSAKSTARKSAFKSSKSSKTSSTSGPLSWFSGSGSKSTK